MYKLSHFDAYASTELFGYSDESEYHAALSNFEVKDISIPTLVIQPQDDPLHYNFIHENIKIEHFCCNEHFIFYQPPYGNHFGFYEGRLHEAFSNKTSYTFPAKLGLEFFEAVISNSNDDGNHLDTVSGHQYYSTCFRMNGFLQAGAGEDVGLEDTVCDASSLFISCLS